MRGRALLGALLLAGPGLVLSPSGAAHPSWPAQGSFHFESVGAAAGLEVTTWAGRADKPHLLESGGAGIALLDFDGDGLLDAYIVNGWRLEGERVVERGVNRLYRNRGDLRFEDVTEAAGVGDTGWGTAATVGDIDGDGRPDLYVSNFGPDVLYRNQGDATFAAVDGGPSFDGWSSSAVFFDADADADEDLFVTAYIEATLEEVLTAELSLLWKGVRVMSGPFGHRGAPNRFFRNVGNGRFVEATDEAGLTDVGLFFSFGVIATDLDGDGLLDLYVANDSNPNYVYRNLGGGRFEEVGLWSGAAFDVDGTAQAGMGIAAGDYDRDGRTDFLVTHFAEDVSTLYRNRGDMAFEDATRDAGLAEPTFAPLSWGTCFADFDLDGDLDLFVANGHIYPQADDNPAAATSYAQTNQLFEHVGGRFVDVSETAGPGLAVRESSRGAVCGDLDDDGDVDLVVWEVDAPPTLLRNDTPRRGSWLGVDAPDALWVEVVAGNRRWRQARVNGGSYASAGDPRFHFGLGEAPGPFRLEARWPDGEETAVELRTAGRYVRLTPDGPR